MVNKKGQIGQVLMLGLLTIIVVGVAYIAFAQPWDAIYDKLHDDIDAEYQPTAEKFNSVTKMWPGIILGTVLIWVVVVALQGRSHEGYYG